MSAVILAVIVIMWAVVLVPMWLRRHEAAAESRSADRFSSAMRVLSRRQPSAPDRRYVVMPKRDRGASVHVSGAAASRRPASTRPGPSAPPRPKVRPTAAARRRRTLLGLAAFAFLTFLLAVTGVVGWVLQLVVDLVLVAFVVHLRTQAKRTAAVARQRRRSAVAPSAPTGSTPAPSPRRAPAPPAPAYASAPSAPASYDEQVGQAAAAATGTDDASASDAWDPVPVPPPTYTMKPKAPPRRTWTPAGAEAPGEMAPTAPQPEADTDELEGILEHRWAVND